MSQEVKEQIELTRVARETYTSETNFQVSSGLENHSHHNSELEEEPLLSKDEVTPSAPEVTSSSWRQRCASYFSKVENYVAIFVLTILHHVHACQEKVVQLFKNVLEDLSTAFKGGMWKTTVLLLFIWYVGHGCHSLEETRI